MRTSTVAMAVPLAVTLAFAAAQGSFAQQPRDTPNGRTPSAAVSNVSDSDLETFASIYVDLLGTASKFEAELGAAQTEEQALEIRGRAQTESVAKVAQHGWSPEKFNSVSEAINGDPALTERAVKLIEAK
jgi:hypothetical protein